MLNRLYVDNYKTLVNFEFTPRPVQLLLGRNGSGKSTVFDVLLRLRDLIVDHAMASSVFPSESRTRWDSRTEQAFELDVVGNGSTYHYALHVDHNVSSQSAHVIRETLSADGKPLFAFEHGAVQLYRENSTAGARVPYDSRYSGLSIFGDSTDNPKLKRFHDWMRRLLVVRLNPFHMTAFSKQEAERPASDLSDFASWYRHLVLQEPSIATTLAASLVEVIDGFANLKLDAAGDEGRVLKAFIEVPGGHQAAGKKRLFKFDELSDGQRALIAMYTLLHYATTEPFPLVCIDEPDNFVALAEIQPWLMAIDDMEDKGGQMLLISHHPELINFFAPDRAVCLGRQEGGPVRVNPFATPEAGVLTPSEVVARGWEDEQAYLPLRGSAADGLCPPATNRTRLPKRQAPSSLGAHGTRRGGPLRDRTVSARSRGFTTTLQPSCRRPGGDD